MFLPYIGMAAILFSGAEPFEDVKEDKDKILIETKTFYYFKSTLQISAISLLYSLRTWHFNIFPIQIYGGANLTLPMTF